MLSRRLRLHLSVEINIGIMAACIPTLPSGYKWCRRRMRSQKNSATAHLPLPENAEFQPIKLSKKHHPDRDISNALRSETDSTRNLFDGIQKTIQIDVERTPVESSATDEGKPNLRLNLRPRFESLRSLWVRILDNGRQSQRGENSSVE